MADIVLGIGSSHSPMLSTPHEAFAGHVERDRARVPNFEALAREKAAWIGRELAADVTRARHAATQAALARLSATLAEAALDAVVVIGDDQGEWFSPDSQPALCIYWGNTVESLPPPSSAWRRPSGSRTGATTATEPIASFRWMPNSDGI